MKHYLKALRHYADFSGRASRTEYWMFVLFNIIFMFAAAFLGALLGAIFNEYLIQYFATIFVCIYYFAVAIPFLAISVRRLHDSGKSGWWMLLGLLNILNSIIGNMRSIDTGLKLFFAILAIAAGICIIVFMVLPSSENANRYGANPKHILTCGRRIFAKSAGITLVTAAALYFVNDIFLSPLIIHFHSMIPLYYYEYFRLSLLLFNLPDLFIIAAGILLLLRKERNTAFAVLLISAAVLWIARTVYFEAVNTIDYSTAGLLITIRIIISKALIVVPFALLPAGLAWLRKSNPNIPIKIKPEIAAISLAATALFWIAFNIFALIADIISSSRDLHFILNILNIIMPIAFLVLALYLFKYDTYPAETAVTADNSEPIYEPTHASVAKNSKIN
jgi:uncharacterized membrane protein YhaH (DUF805 family)